MTGSLSAQAAYARGVETFDAVLRRVRTDQWTAATPCVEWDVRTLVNHVVGEDRWVPPLLAGLTIAEVGDTLAGDLLGDDPQLAWDRARHEAEGAVRAVPDDLIVALSAGPTAVAEYLWQLAADHRDLHVRSRRQRQMCIRDRDVVVVDWYGASEYAR